MLQTLLITVVTFWLKTKFVTQRYASLDQAPRQYFDQPRSMVPYKIWLVLESLRISEVWESISRAAQKFK